MSIQFEMGKNILYAAAKSTRFFPKHGMYADWLPVEEKIQLIYSTIICHVCKEFIILLFEFVSVSDNQFYSIGERVTSCSIFKTYRKLG